MNFIKKSTFGAAVVSAGGITVVALGVTYLIQLVVFGILVPELGSAKGFMDDHDSSRFNVGANELESLIQERGWSAWRLEYAGQPVVGVLGAVYAAIAPSPFVWAVVQSMMYGLAGGLMAVVFCKLPPGSPLPLVALGMALFFPTAAMIYVLPHNDIFVFLGYALFVAGWWGIVGTAKPRMAWWQEGWRVVLGVSAAIAGMALSGVFRDFTVDMFAAISVLLWIMVCGLALFRFKRERAIGLRVVMPVLAGAVVLVVALGGFERAAFTLAEDSADTSPSPPLIGSALAKETPCEVVETTRREQEVWQWQASGWLPELIDERMKEVSRARERVIDLEGHARTAVDLEIRFASAMDVIVYIPRSVQLSVLSPFPNMWLPHPEASFSRNLQRVLAGAEMVVFYALLPGLFFAIWKWRWTPALWCLLIPAGVWLTTYGLAVPVIGSIARFRFPAFATLVALSLLGVMAAVMGWRTHRRRPAR